MNRLFTLIRLCLFIISMGFLACHLTKSKGTEETFDFPTLKATISGADHAVIVLKDTNGTTIDTLFNGTVTQATDFRGLDAPNYKGGRVLIAIEATQNGQLIYKVDRTFDGRTNMDIGSVVVMSPGTTVSIGLVNPQIREGDSILLPTVIINPAALANRDVDWLSRNPTSLEVTRTHLKGLRPGKATLVVTLKSDTAKKDSVFIEVTSRTGPNRPIVTGPAIPVNTLTPKWTWVSGGGGGNGIFRYRLDSEDMTQATLVADTFFISPTSLAEGVHTLFVQERDEVGNWSLSGRYAIRIDRSAPKAPIITSSFGSLTSNRKPAWKWSSGGEGDISIFRSKLDNPDFTVSDTGTLGKIFAPSDNLDEGVHTLYVQERDSAGNWSTNGQYSLKIDATPPSAPVFSATPLSPMNTLKPIWSWSSSGGDGIGIFRLKINDGSLDSGAIQVSQPSYTPTSDLKQDAYTLFVQERDSAGNWSAVASKKIVLALSQIVGKPGFSSGRAPQRIVISNTGVPYVAYHDQGLKIMRFDGKDWSLIPSPALFGYEFQTFSFAIDSSGVLYISEGGKPRVVQFSGGIWSPVGDKWPTTDTLYPFSEPPLHPAGLK